MYRQRSRKVKFLEPDPQFCSQSPKEDPSDLDKQRFSLKSYLKRVSRYKTSRPDFVQNSFRRPPEDCHISWQFRRRTFLTLENNTVQSTHLFPGFYGKEGEDYFSTLSDNTTAAAAAFTSPTQTRIRKPTTVFGHVPRDQWSIDRQVEQR